MATLLTVADAAKAVGASQGVGDFADEDLVQTYIDAAVEVVEDLSRPVKSLSHTVLRDGGRESILLPWPFSEITEVKENDTTLAAGDYVANGPAGIVYRGSSTVSRLWWPGRLNISITASVGVESVPGNQKLAAMMEFAHLWRTRNGPRPKFAQPGGDVVLTPSGFAVPNAVAELLVATPRLPGFA